MPQPLGAHELAEDETRLPPLVFDANVETFLRTCRLPHFGHATSAAGAVTRTNSSNEL